MSDDELGGRVNNDISAMLEWLYQVWCRKCIVQYQWYPILVSDISGGANIQGIKTWIADGFSIDSFSPIIDGSTEVFRVTAIHEANSDSQFRERVMEEVICSAVQAGR